MSRDYKKFNEFLNSIPIEEFHKKNNEQLDKNAQDFKDLKDALSEGICNYCGNPISHFSDRKPCFHWFLKPNGFKTRHFPLLYKIKSYHNINPYLRWVANSDSPIRNINDLVEDKSPSKIIEETICYKNIEWSFSCSHGDYTGHKDKQEGKAPHYHFQMKVDGKIFIKYGQFHIPFSEYDQFCFAVSRGEFDRLKAGHVEGAGMQTFYENFTPEEILNFMTDAGENDSTAQFRTQTLVIADEGTTISGDDLADIFEEHKKTKVPLAKLIRQLKNVTAESYITPGPGVPEIAARKPNRRSKKE